MKKFIEIWKNKRLILQGIWYSMFRSKYIEKIAKERMEICESCDQLDKEGTNCLWEGTQPCCSECGCSLEYKTRSIDASCPLEYWKAVEEDN